VLVAAIEVVAVEEIVAIGVGGGVVVGEFAEDSIVNWR